MLKAIDLRTSDQDIPRYQWLVEFRINILGANYIDVFNHALPGSEKIYRALDDFCTFDYWINNKNTILFENQEDAFLIYMHFK